MFQMLTWVAGTVRTTSTMTGVAGYTTAQPVVTYVAGIQLTADRLNVRLPTLKTAVSAMSTGLA